MNAQTKNVEINGFDEKAMKALKQVADPLKQALEQIINEAPVSNTLACYDTGAEFDGAEIAADAAEFVLKGLIGAFCYNVVEGYKGNGQTMLNRALDQVDEAAERDATFRTEKSADQLHQRIVWAAKMDVQQAYRLALQPYAEALYTVITGERYTRKVDRTVGKPASEEQSVADKLRERRQAARS